MSPLRAQKFNAIYRFVTTVYFYNYPNSANYPERLNSVSVFRWSLLRWAQSIELISVSGDRERQNPVSGTLCYIKRQKDG
jgi:hypothetical protein